MGQPIVVVEKPSTVNPGMVRFETNRALTGMGHERYVAGTEVRGDRPPDEVARRLLALGGIAAVHVNGSVVTVDLVKGHRSDGMREVIEELFIHYPAGAEDDVVPDADQPETDGELVEQVASAEGTAPAPDPDTEALATSAGPAEVAGDEPVTVDPEAPTADPGTAPPA